VKITSAQPVWISPRGYERLQRELARLRASHTRADADGQPDDSAIAVQRAWQARIKRIHDLLFNAAVGEDPPDDGIAEPGMVLTIRYDGTGDVETFLLGVRGAECTDVEVYSNESPLGAAIAGARVGERRTYTLPNGTSQTVTLLEAVPYGIHMAGTKPGCGELQPHTPVAGHNSGAQSSIADDPVHLGVTA
jgi:transcription elongation GreA/GreB family factor